MLMKIGDVTNQLGISHRSLHYWESVGILKSTRGNDNDYRYYDEENLQKIKQIILLRKLRLSIPSIQEIFSSEDLTKVISVFTAHLDASKKEITQLDSLGIVVKQLINMLRDKQSMESVYTYLDTNHSCETEELKDALHTIFSEPLKEVSVDAISEPMINMSGIDLSLDEMAKEDIPAVTEIVKRCYNDIKELDKLLFYLNMEQQLSEPDCTWYYKITHVGECIGVINLAYVGMEAMVIRCFACLDSDINAYIFELLKQKFPDVLSWNIYIAQDDNIEDFTYDWNGKKRQFADDNGFVFYTDSRWNRFVKMLKPHDEVYNSSRYRFALLDGSMDGVAFRFFGIDKLDFYDGSLTNCRMTDVNFCNAVIYDTWLANSRFYESSIENSDFRFSNFSGSTFTNVSFEKCKFESCNLDGLTIDDIDVKNALEFYKENK